MTIKIKMLAKVVAKDNNNKFYEVKLNESGEVSVRYGRVGYEGTIESKGLGGEALFDKVVASKVKTGYKPVDVMTTSTAASGTTKVSGNIADLAHREVAKGDPTLKALMDRLATINRFDLLSASGGKIDIVDGQVKTALGLVTLPTVNKARKTLISIQSSSGSGYDSLLEEYLHLIPQKVPSRKGWHTSFFTETTSFTQQNSLLDQLESSIKLAEQSMIDQQTSTSAETKTDQQKLFGYSMRLLDANSPEFASISKFYESNINKSHVSSALRLKRVYVLENEDKLARFKSWETKVGNVQRLWHGTRAHNVLSILKGGLIVPTSAGGYTITGRMFGDGLYFSDQSSKSLNYAYGYWDRSGGYESNCFMFLADVAMGKSYTPPRPMSSPPSGYDSMFAVGGKSGVQNNEMIVYNVDQAHLTYLCEFDK